MTDSMFEATAPAFAEGLPCFAPPPALASGFPLPDDIRLGLYTPLIAWTVAQPRHAGKAQAATGFETDSISSSIWGAENCSAWGGV